MKNFKIFSFLLLFFTPLLSFAQTSPGDTLWAKSTANSSTRSIFIEVAADSNGNSYGLGYIQGNAPFDFGNGVTVTGAFSGDNILLVKYGADGNALWAKSMVGSSDRSRIEGISIDNNGNIYVVGLIYSGTYNLGNGVTVSGATSAVYIDILIAKYDANGNALWARSTTSGSNDSRLYDVAVDSSGNIYAAGVIKGTVAYGFGDGVTATGAISGNNVVLIKYNTSGTAQWAKTMVSGSSSSEFYTIAIDSSGNPYAGGRINGASPYGFGNSVSATGASTSSNIILVKYDSSGNAQWAKTTTSAANGSLFQALALDIKGNIFAAGVVYDAGAYGFGDGVNATAPVSSSNVNALLLAYNSNGNAQWAKLPTAAPVESWFYGVAADTIGNIYTAGYIRGPNQYDFGNNVTVKGTDPTYNPLLVNYDNKGNTLLARSIVNATSTSTFYGMGINDNTGDVYAGGTIYGNSTYDFGNNINVNGATYDEYNSVIVKYHGYTIPESSSSSSSSNNSPVDSDASSMKHRLPKLFAVGGAILLLF